MNSVTLIGRLATDVDLREVNGGFRVATFILAVDRSQEEADFFRIRLWNLQAELVAEHVGKGRRVAIEGSLRQDISQAEGGERRSVSVLARHIEFL